jgi:nitrate reductase gamma subunit
MPRLAVFWLLHAAAAAVFVAGCGLRVSVWLQGSVEGRTAPGLPAALRAAWRLVRRAGPRRALSALFVDGLLHRRLLAAGRGRWFAHACLLGGFAAMFALSLLTGFCTEVLVGLLGVHHPLVLAIVAKDTPAMALANETLGLVMLAGMALVAGRRYLVRPAQLRTAAPDTALVLLLGATLVSGYPVEALRLIAEGVPAHVGWYSYIGYALSLPLRGLAWPWPALHDAAFFFHTTVASAFFAYVPFSKFFHALVSPLVATANRLRREVEPA